MPESQEERKYIRGEVVFVIYEDTSTNFTIARVKIHQTTEDYDQADIVCKGTFGHLQKGVLYDFYGQLTTHPKFGVQYNVDAYRTFVPETKEAVITYLSSDLFPGVGKKTATKIVATLGEGAVNAILKNPDILDTVPNISNKVKQTIVTTLLENQGLELVAVELAKYGIGLKMAQTLFLFYRERTLELLQTNPYQFVFDIEGFGFPTADKIAFALNLDPYGKNRLQAACYYALQLAALSGHVYLPIPECVQEMQQILRLENVTKETYRQEIEELAHTKTIIMHEDKLYLPSLYYAEEHFVLHLQRLLAEPVDFSITDAELMSIIGEIEAEEALSYGTDQFMAIKQALSSKVMVLTGGPGTGKTTVIKGIIAAYAKIHNVSLHRHDYRNSEDYPFILTAPTGRAAKRLQESTGLNATTIHRLLGWDGKVTFEKNEFTKLSGKILIIDEFSMVDTWLANQLFRAIPDDMQVIIVGDEDQLPSVGPGQVLADLISSNVLPVRKLHEVYRQKEGSKIIEIANKIKYDQLTTADLEKSEDFSFIPCEANQLISVIHSIFSRALEKGISPHHIQVLAPLYKTDVGINKINQELQQLINPKASQKRERRINEVIYRVGDRVLQLVNQPEDGVYNGDIGVIIDIVSAREADDNEEKIVVQFDEKEVSYARADYHHFMHAYCISIHKAQGSEFPIVVLPILPQYGRMLRKNLIYTAITRSKQTLIICGDLAAFFKGLARVDTENRYTTLKELLLQKFTAHPAQKDAVAQQVETDLLDELSPYDFL